MPNLKCTNEQCDFEYAISHQKIGKEYNKYGGIFRAVMWEHYEQTEHREFELDGYRFNLFQWGLMAVIRKALKS